MQYVIHIVDNSGMVEKRKELVPVHRDYVLASGMKVLMSGPLLADDGETMIGSLTVVDVGDKSEIEPFLANDPFEINGVWGKREIHAFYWRVGRQTA